jgi:hypothetical protein
MARKLIRDYEAENERLVAENAQLRDELAELKALEAPVALKPEPAKVEGTIVSYPPPPSSLVMPSDDDLHRLMDIALTAFPSLAPKIELSFMQRLTLRNHPSLADQIKPDVEAITADFFREFKNSFIAIGSMKLKDEPARKYFVGHWTETAQSWLRQRNMFFDITTSAFIAAALAHGVSYTDGTIDGSSWELGIDSYSGRAVTDGWRRVLAGGKVLPSTAIPSNRRLAAARPARVW